MILVWLIVIPLAGGVLAWLTGRRSRAWPRWISLASLGVDVVLMLALAGKDLAPGGSPWLAEFKADWIPQFGISFHLAADGLSLILMLLTGFMGAMAVAASWRTAHERTGLYHLCLMSVLAFTIGVFMALDLFLFYFLWELMLVPMYFLIGVWGLEKRRAAAVKFFIFTQFSGLLMLLSILALYFIHGRASGEYTFDYTRLLGASLSGKTAMWLMLGFFVAFAVKLGVVPFHAWLPDAYEQAPAAGSVILAALMAKTGAYGLLRFVVPLFPEAAAHFAGVAMVLAVLSILYGAILAFAQRDLKRLIAYSSISHMGFVLLGVFVWNRLSLQGVTIQMVAHGVSTGALFIIIGALQERIGTRELARMGGLWSAMPRMGAIALVFALAAMGLPGLGNFVGEFLVLLGTFRVSVMFAAIAAAGAIFSVIYALWMIHRVFQGERKETAKPADLGHREIVVLAVLIAAIVWLGVYPRPVLGLASPALDALQSHTAKPIAPPAPPPLPGRQYFQITKLDFEREKAPPAPFSSGIQVRAGIDNAVVPIPLGGWTEPRMQTKGGEHGPR